jgi:polar amino acid transport system permease protein
MKMDLVSTLKVLLDGTIVTVELTVISFVIAFSIAIVVSLAQIYGNIPLKIIATVYERILRSIPLLVVMFILFFGLPSFGIRFNPFMAAILSLGLCSSAYQSQIFRGAILSVPKGQTLAAQSIGMNGTQIFVHVTLPQALRFAVAPLTNEFTIVLKDTSFAYALGVTELLREGTYIVSTTYEPLLIYLLCAAIYFTVTFSTNTVVRRIEKRFALPGFEFRGERA